MGDNIPFIPVVPVRQKHIYFVAEGDVRYHEIVRQTLLEKGVVRMREIGSQLRKELSDIVEGESILIVHGVHRIGRQSADVLAETLRPRATQLQPAADYQIKATSIPALLGQVQHAGIIVAHRWSFNSYLRGCNLPEMRVGKHYKIEEWR